MPRSPSRDRQAGQHKTALVRFAPLRHMRAQQIRFTRGFHSSTPSALRVLTLPAVCSLLCLATTRQSQQHPWGSSFKALLPPTRGTPFGASPLLSFPGLARMRDRREFRGFSEIGEGNDASVILPAGKPTCRADSSNLAFLGVRPSRAFSSIALQLASNHSPSCPSTENAPYGFRSRAGLQGFSVR